MAAVNQVGQAISAEQDRLRDRLTAFLQVLVRIPSLPGQEQKAQEFMAQKLRALKLEVEIVPTIYTEVKDHPAFCDDGIPFENRLNVVGRWKGRSEGPARTAPTISEPARSLILNGHMDVVATGSESLWADSPWSGNIRDGKLYGRGSCDMKAGLTSIIFAIEALKVLRFQPTADVIVESVIGEESGGVGTLTTLVKGIRADAAVITEPTRLRLCPVQAGALTFRLKVPGRAVHACMKKYGVSAIEKFYQVLSAVNEFDNERHAKYHNPLYEDPENVAPISLGTIRGGNWPSTVPDELVVEGRCGVFPGESLSAAKKALETSIGRAAEADLWLREHPPKLEWVEGQFESGETSMAEPIVRTLTQCHQEIAGEPPMVQGVTYGSDLRLFTNHGKIPALLYGPGNILSAHAVDEYVEIEEVVRCAKVLALLICGWCGGGNR